MKVLIDAMLPWRLANLFRKYGHEARHVRGLGDQARTDRQIWQTAIASGEIVITAEKDFTILQSAGPHAKLIRYRGFNRSRAEILRDFDTCMEDIEAFATNTMPSSVNNPAFRFEQGFLSTEAPAAIGAKEASAN